MYLVVAYYAGLYNKYYRRSDLIRSTVWATLAVLSAYALLPEQYRFSRGILTFGALLAFAIISVVRWLMLQSGLLQEHTGKVEKPYLLIAGTTTEFNALQALLKQHQLSEKVIGRVGLDPFDKKALIPISAIQEVAFTLKATELILCAGTLSYKNIIGYIQKIRSSIRIRFHAFGSDSIVGSDSSGSSGEVLSVETQFKLGQSSERRTKRLIDTVFSLMFLLTFPLHVLLVQQPVGFLRNCLAVLLRKKTWIGFAASGKGLPRLRKGILAPNGYPVKSEDFSKESLQLVDHYYARDYEPVQDLRLIIKNYRRLGN
jgi:hypothetical protein